jgi:hypothetical protein
MKKLNALICAFILVVGVLATPSIAKNRGDYQFKQSKSNQVIKTGQWTTLKFKGGNSLTRTKNYRTMFCTKVHLDTRKGAPEYVKIRFARIKSGKDDTTGTNTWVTKGFKGRYWQGALCWTIDTKYPVVAQIKIEGSKKSYTSYLRQFKAWSPPYELPADMTTPAPEAIVDVVQ